MDSKNTEMHAQTNKCAPTYIERGVVELLSILLADVETDINVAARDLQISDASFVRLRRALDRVACAQSVLETMRVRSAGASGEETALRVRMRDAVELLARGWPEDYPAGAVEWLLLSAGTPPQPPERGDTLYDSSRRHLVSYPLLSDADAASKVVRKFQIEADIKPQSFTVPIAFRNERQGGSKTDAKGPVFELVAAFSRRRKC